MTYVATRAGWVSVAMFVCLGARGHAWAEVTPSAVVVVAQDGALDGKALAVTLAVEELLRKESTLSLVDIRHRGVAAQMGERTAAGERGRAELAEAQKAFDDLEIGRANAQATTALALLGKSNLEEGPAALLEALAFKALVSQVKASGVEEATQHLKTLFTLDVTYQSKPGRLNPRFSELAERVRAQTTAGPRMALEVQSSEGPALAYVDGVFRGVTPCTIKDVVAGSHYVTVLTPGFAPVQSVVDTSQAGPFIAKPVPGTEVPQLQGWTRELKGALAKGDVAKAGDLARWAGAKQVLLASLAVRNGKLEVNAIRVSTESGAPRSVLKTRTQEPPGDTADLAAFVFSTLRAPAKEAQAPLLNASAASTPGSNRTLGFVALGTSAATALGGLLLGAYTLNQANQAERVPQMDDATYKKLNGTAQVTGTVANVLYAVSLASAAVGGWLLLTEPKAPPALATLNIAPVPGGAVLAMERSF